MTVEDQLVAHAMVDEDGRLIEAAPRVAALQAAAGAGIGDLLAVPPIASVARLARSLGIVVSRGIVVGEGRATLDLWVRAQPEGSGVRLAVSGWRRREDQAPDATLAAARAAAFAALERDGSWACDATMMVLTMGIDFDLSIALPAPITSLFRMVPADDGELPFLVGFASQSAFHEQAVILRANPDARLSINGNPVVDAEGRFAGFEGGFRWIERPGSARPKFAVGGEVPANTIPFGMEQALRGPLDRIIRNADAIGARSQGPLRQEYVGYAGDIAAASRHLLGLVDDLGDLQTVEQSGFSTEADPIDLADVARRAAGLLGVRAADRGVKIDSSDADDPLMAVGDFRRVLQILVNLIGNAVRYAPRGTSIWVRLEETGDLAAIVIADQGPGIAVEDQARIFDKFERVDPSEPGGSGLGLYISRRLARAMGGDITLDSAPGQGARFVLTLPRAPDVQRFSTGT